MTSLTTQQPDFNESYLKVFSNTWWTASPTWNYMRTKWESIILRKFNDDWEKEDIKMTNKDLKWCRILLKTTQYQAYSALDKWDYESKKILWESEEFLDVWGKQSFVFFDQVREKAYTDLYNTKSIKERMEREVEPWMLLFVEYREIIYVDMPKHWVVKMYLKLSQTVWMEDRAYMFKDPVKDWLRNFLAKKEVWANCPKIVFDMEVKWNWARMETFYPVFLNWEEKLDDSVFEKAKEIFTTLFNIKESKLAKYNFDWGVVWEAKEEGKKETNVLEWEELFDEKKPEVKKDYDDLPF